MEIGTLKNTKTYPNNHSIKYTSPYAHYMYKGKKAIGASKPNDRKKDIVKDIENFIKRSGSNG